MKVFKILVILTVLLLVAGIALLVFSIHTRLTTSEYQFQVDAVLAAASVANQGEPLTDPDKAVISEYNGKQTVIVPGNYTNQWASLLECCTGGTYHDDNIPLE